MDRIDDEGPELTLVEFVGQMPMYLQAFVAATVASGESDGSFNVKRTHEDWLRELLAYEMVTRIEEHTNGNSER